MLLDLPITINTPSAAADINGTDQQLDDLSTITGNASPPAPINPRDGPIDESSPPRSYYVPSSLREKFLRRRMSPTKREESDTPGNAGGGPAESEVRPHLSQPSELKEEQSDVIPSGLREKFLRRRARSEKSDIDDDVVDLKPSMKPIAINPTTTTKTNAVIPLHTTTSPINPPTHTNVTDTENDVVDLKPSMKPTTTMPTTTVIPLHTTTSPLNQSPPTNVKNVTDTFSSDTSMDVIPILSKSPTSQKILLPPLATPTHVLPSNAAPSNTSPHPSPFAFKKSSPTGSPPPAVNPHLMAWIAQAREWKELYADDAKAYFYYKETTQESQWETPTSQGYTRADTRLVLQNGTVIDDPALKASSSMSSIVPSNQPVAASTTNDANTMLAQMLAWKNQEDALELTTPYLEKTSIPTGLLDYGTGGLNNSNNFLGDGHVNEAVPTAAPFLPSGLRENFLRRRVRSEKSDIDDDVVDLKSSMKPIAMTPTTTTKTNAVMAALFTDSSPPKNTTTDDAIPSATSPSFENRPEYHL